MARSPRDGESNGAHRAAAEVYSWIWAISGAGWWRRLSPLSKRRADSAGLPSIGTSTSSSSGHLVIEGLAMKSKRKIAFDVEAFLGSAGLARKIVTYRLAEVIFTQALAARIERCARDTGSQRDGRE